MRKAAQPPADSGGEGRLGRHWVSPEGTPSPLAYENTMPPERLAPVTLAVALAVLRHFGGSLDAPASIKWAQRYLYKREKGPRYFGGNRLPGRENSYIVAGIGINVNQREFPAEVENGRFPSECY